MSIDDAAYDHIAVERADADVVWIALDEPERNNTLDHAMLAELDDAIATADRDSSVQGMVLGSTSEELFCAGADLEELAGLDLEGSYRFLSTYTDTVERMWATGKPIVAAVPGVCVAGGNELAMGCDLIVAGESARFGQPEANVGSTAAGGGVQVLPLLVGMQRAKDLLLTSRLLSAEEAEAWGLVNRVVDDDAVDERASELVREIVDGKSPYAYRVMKALFKRWYDTAMTGSAVDVAITAAVWTNPEFRERAAAFMAGEDFEPREFVGTQ